MSIFSNDFVTIMSYLFIYLIKKCFFFSIKKGLIQRDHTEYTNIIQYILQRNLVKETTNWGLPLKDETCTNVVSWKTWWFLDLVRYRHLFLHSFCNLQCFFPKQRSPTQTLQKRPQNSILSSPQNKFLQIIKDRTNCTALHVMYLRCP